MYQPNSNTKVQVSTPLGMSSMAVTGENIGQGSIPGALVSSLNLDLNVLKKCNDSKEVCYGSVQLGTLLFQDDAMHLETTVANSQDGRSRFLQVMKRMLLEINTSKSVTVILGKKTKKTRGLQLILYYQLFS